MAPPYDPASEPHEERGPEELGIDVYPGFAGAQLLLSPSPDADARKEESAHRLKHPHIPAFLANGTCLAYGAHALTEGRLHAVPPAARLSRRGVGWRLLFVLPATILATD
ncbi:hypothetical protein K438DRAFT_1982131 [Mycena galopus ATCC 62051]|nr:hypothetical protein K438DRAFT_1982131 [Mycena galopus ATCC 62051]